MISSIFSGYQKSVLAAMFFQTGRAVKKQNRFFSCCKHSSQIFSWQFAWIRTCIHIAICMLLLSLSYNLTEIESFNMFYKLLIYKPHQQSAYFEQGERAQIISKSSLI